MMPEGKPLYKAELVAHTSDRNNLLEFYIHSPDGRIRKLWIRTNGTVKLESGSNRMKDLIVPNTQLKGLAMAAESNVEQGAILNAVGLEIGKSFFQKAQARWSLNAWLEALRIMNLGRKFLIKKSSEQDPLGNAAVGNK